MWDPLYYHFFGEPMLVEEPSTIVCINEKLCIPYKGTKQHDRHISLPFFAMINQPRIQTHQNFVQLTQLDATILKHYFDKQQHTALRGFREICCELQVKLRAPMKLEPRQKCRKMVASGGHSRLDIGLVQYKTSCLNQSIASFCGSSRQSIHLEGPFVHYPHAIHDHRF